MKGGLRCGVLSCAVLSCTLDNISCCSKPLTFHNGFMIFFCFASLFQALAHVQIQIRILLHLHLHFHLHIHIHIHTHIHTHIHIHTHVRVRVLLCACFCVCLCLCLCVCLLRAVVPIVCDTWVQGRKANRTTSQLVPCCVSRRITGVNSFIR